MSPSRPGVERAVILGCAGTEPTAEETRFFRDTNPFGFILFARNIEDPEQLRRLCGRLRECVDRSDAPILIDQEGGRVQRLRPPQWRDAPPMRRFGELCEHNPQAAREALRLNTALIADDLKKAGISVVCAPVLDVPTTESHEIIGDRAFSGAAGMVAELGRQVVDDFLRNGVIPVIKHFPGHGRALADSHLALPTVTAPAAELEKTDLLPFRENISAPFMMTAHVVYTAWDDKNPATLSTAILQNILRRRLGYQGLVISDDLSMQALDGFSADPAERARGCLNAGCDIVLHCNGNMAEMQQVAAGAALLTDAARAGWKRIKALVKTPPPINRAAMESALHNLLAGRAGGD